MERDRLALPGEGRVVSSFRGSRGEWRRSVCLATFLETDFCKSMSLCLHEKGLDDRKALGRKEHYNNRFLFR